MKALALPAAALVLAASLAPSRANAQTAFRGDPSPIPGTIKAVDFDAGGLGIAYGDTTPGNIGGAYRPSEDVDIAELSGANNVLGWTDQGEWLKYTVNVDHTGPYLVSFSLASQGQGGTFHLEVPNGTNVTGAVTVPDTGGWDTWQTVTRRVNLTAGTQVMTLVMDSVGDAAVGNFDWIRFDAASNNGGNTLRMVTWNVDGGYDNDDQTNWTLPQQAEHMASLNPDILVLQEVGRWDRDDAVLYRDLLQQATGQTWYYYTVAGAQCEAGGCIVMEILSRFPILEAETKILYPSAAGRALIDVGGTAINVFTCHLEWYDLDVRTAELLGMMNWAAGFGGPRLVGGDFNSWWDEWWIHRMETEYSDTWVDVTGQQDGAYTTGNVRFDYIFRSFDNGWRLTPTNAFVSQVELSDHRPFVGDFTVR